MYTISICPEYGNMGFNLRYDDYNNTLYLPNYSCDANDLYVSSDSRVLSRSTISEILTEDWGCSHYQIEMLKNEIHKMRQGLNSHLIGIDKVSVFK